MTPKDKARELFGKMYSHFRTRAELDICRQCALIAVDEIIDLLPNINLTPPIQRRPDEFYFQYWVIVKQEIEGL
jgi:hypothetical protein